MNSISLHDVTRLTNLSQLNIPIPLQGLPHPLTPQLKFNKNHRVQEMWDSQKYHQLYRIMLFFSLRVDVHVLAQLFQGLDLNSTVFHLLIPKILGSRYRGTYSFLHVLHNVVAIKAIKEKD